MTAPGRYAASDGSFAKSAGSAAARGAMLIGVALLIGFVLLKWGFDGGDADAGAPITDTDDTTDDDPDGDDTDDGTVDTTTTVGEDGGPDTTTTAGEGDPNTTTTAGAVLDPPSSITVTVLNGTGEPGLAGTRGETLGALGYVWKAGNAAEVPVTESKVYFLTGFGDEAGEVAAALSGPATVLELAPDDPTTLASEAYAQDVADADIIVVLGTDNALS